MEHDKDNDADTLPQALVDELKARYRAITLLTARVDREIGRQATEQFSAQRRPHRRIEPRWLAAAASVLVVVALGTLSLDDEAPAVVLADIDGSGQVDIADVLALARQRGPAEISAAELDALAWQVVSLDRWEDAS